MRDISLLKLGLACMTVGLVAVVAGLLLGGVRYGFVAPEVVVDRAPVSAASARPSTAADEDKSDGIALNTLQHNGANLAKRTTITHYLYVPATADARAAADALELRGFTIVLERPQGAGTAAAVRTDWGVVASRVEVPTLEHLRATRALFKALARRYGGSYDGWEAVVVP